MSATVFVGGGRITAAIVAGLRGAGFRGRIVVHDRNPKKVRALSRRFQVHAEPSLARAVAQAGMLIIAVRPADVLPVLGEIGPLPRTAMCVSLAAGLTLSELRGATGGRVAWARAMPSPACRTGHGLTALAFDRSLPRAARLHVRRLFARVGATLKLPEREFDAFTVVYSTSQGCHALAARIRAARKIGLSSKIAFVAAAHGLAEGVRALEENPGALEELLAEAATPGGIAAEVMRVMLAGGYDQLVERAYRAGVARARRRSTK